MFRLTANTSVFARLLAFAMRAFTRLAFALLVFASSQSAFADERILSFAANIDLRADGTADVTEFIEVRGEQLEIRRGIFRYIPTVLTTENGGLQRSSLTVISVKKDGQDAPWFTEKEKTGLSIYIGEANTFIGTGVFRYEIHYVMDRQARIQSGDSALPDTARTAEFYWNITGNYWSFPIEKTVATITLPPNATAGRVRGFTGYAGSTGSDVTITRQTPGSFIIRATRAFDKNEGMTVAVEFNADALTPVSANEKAANFLADNRAIIFPVFGVFLVLLYYFFAWSSVGRDPQKGTIFPRFYPPKTFSPALTHYVAEMGWKRSGWTAFTAALVSLAVKGLIKFDETGGKTKFVLRDHKSTSLPAGEALIMDMIIKEGGVTVNKSNGETIQSTKSALLSALKKENSKIYFRNNRLYIVLGLLLSVAVLLTLFLVGVIEFGLLVIAVMSGFFALFFVTFISRIFRTGLGAGSWLRLILIPIFVVNFGGTILRSLDLIDLSTLTEISPIVAVVSIVLLNILFALIMRAPTAHGRAIMDEIEGFKMYLETAEKGRLNIDDEPELNPKRFEEILPFAIALGVEKPWSERFQKEFIDVQPASETAYQANWYAGRGFDSGNLGQNIGKTFVGLSSAMIAAQPVSSSSSSGFSGGGGSSGGGGGGGGGGGW